MKKKMKPATRSLIITLCILVVLGAAAAALLLPDMLSGGAQGGESSQTSSSETGTQIISKSPAEVESVTVENENGTFHILTKTESGASSPTFYVEEMADIPTSSSSLQSIARYAYVLTATTDVGALDEVNALSEYGLDKPAATMTAKFNDGTADFKLSIGNEAAAGGYYVMANDHLYIASIDKAVFSSMYAFIESSLFTLSIKGDGSDVIDYVHLSGTNFEEPISMIHTDGSENTDYNALFMPYVVTEPHLSGVNTGKIDDFTKALSSLQASGTAGYDPDEEMLKATGLDDPYTIFDFSINGQAHKLFIGDVYDNDYRYLMVDDNPVVFAVAIDSISAFTEVTALGMRDGFVWSPVIKKVSGMKVTANGQTWDYQISREVDETASSSSTSSGSSEPTYTYTVKLNGQDSDYEAYRSLYTTTITPSVLSTDKGKQAAEPTLTIEYSYFNGGSTKVEYYALEGGERRYAAYVAGEFVGIAKETFVTDIIKALPQA